MLRKLVVLFASFFIVMGSATTHAAKPSAPTGTIVVNEAGPYAFGDTITFTTTAQGLKSNQTTLAYILCRSAIEPDYVLYDKFDSPTAEFVLGGQDAWAWLLRPGEEAYCIGRLYSYTVKGTSSTIHWLADSPSFIVTGPAP